MSKLNIRKSFQEIYDKYVEKSFADDFTLESINTIFEIGNDVLYKNNEEEINRLLNKTPSNAPDIMDDEPYSLDRSLAIYEKLSSKYTKVCAELVERIFEVNSNLAWHEYKLKYFEYIKNIYQDYENDEYINYLASVMFFETKDFENSLICVNRAIAQNNSSSHYSHIKGLCFMQMGDYDRSRTFLYQSLFLIELLQDVPPRLKGEPKIYPNYPIEYHTSADLVRMDLNRIDNVESFYDYQIQPLVEEIFV